MTTILVWVLVVSSWQSSRTMVEELGPYVDLESCQRVQRSAPVREFTSQCIQVNIPVVSIKK